MSGFRDMTFCPFFSDCAKAGSCHRPLTPKVIADAHKWWGSDAAPILVFTEKPPCHVEASLVPPPLTSTH